MLFLSFCFRYVFHFASKFQFYKTHSNISCKFKHILYYGPLKQSLLPWRVDFQVAIYDKLTDVFVQIEKLIKLFARALRGNKRFALSYHQIVQ